MEDAIGNTLGIEPARQRGSVISGMPLVDVHGVQVEAHRRAPLQGAQEHQEPITVLTTRHGDQDPVAVVDQVVLGDRPPDVAQKLSLEFHAVAHATLKGGLGPRMSRRAPGLTARAWLGAAAGSAVIHVLALWALVGGGAFERALDRSNTVLAANLAAIAAPAFEPDWIDISSAAELQDAPPVTAPPSPDAAAAEPHRRRGRRAPRPAAGHRRARGGGTRSRRAVAGSGRARRAHHRRRLAARSVDDARGAQRRRDVVAAGAPAHGGRRPIVTAGGAARAGGRHWRRDPQRDAGQPAERAAARDTRRIAVRRLRAHRRRRPCRAAGRRDRRVSAQRREPVAGSRQRSARRGAGRAQLR